MKPQWLIQTNMDGVDPQPIISEVQNQGMIVRKIDYDAMNPVNLSYDYPYSAVICYGDINFIGHVCRTCALIPGAWCNFDNMRCGTYYAYLGKYLLNHKYGMLPIGDLLRRWDDNFARCINAWFIRPDSGAKPFTGFVVEPYGKHKIQQLVDSVGPETLVVIAPEKEITAEWRFVVCDRKVVAGCQYLPVESPMAYDFAGDFNAPPSVRLANKIASQAWQPDLCYTVDIAESDGDMYLLEINSFSAAGFYDCDIKSIVKNASLAAIKEWKEYLDPDDSVLV